MQTRKAIWKTLGQHTLKTFTIFLSVLSTAAPLVKNGSSGFTSIPEVEKSYIRKNPDDLEEFRRYYHKNFQITQKPQGNINTSEERRFISSQEGETLPEYDHKFPKASSENLKDVTREEVKHLNHVSPTLFPDTFQPVTWPLTNRERYLTTSGPFVLLNNHRPPSYLSNENNNAYHWLLRPVSSSVTESLDSTSATFPTILITRPTTTSSLEELDGNTAQTYVTSNLSFVKEDNKDPLARPTALVHTNLMIAQRPSSETKMENPPVKPTDRVPLISASTQSNKHSNIKQSTKSTTKRPSSLSTRYTKKPHHRITTAMTTITETAVVPWSDSVNFYISPTSAGMKRPSGSLQPVTSTLSALVANLLRSSILGTFLLMIPSAFLAMMLL